MLATTAASAAPVLFEAHNESRVNIPAGARDTLVELSFSVDTSCYASFTTGGWVYMQFGWFELDGDSLPTFGGMASGTVGSIVIAYTVLLDSGEHHIALTSIPVLNSTSNECINSYLQALVFLPDEEPIAVSEEPEVDPADGVSSLVTSGPYVNVAGATRLVDASGRLIEGAITDERVYVGSLPSGTYFAKENDNTVLKIVKVD